jgi:large subunit ribosomal protein L3
MTTKAILGEKLGMTQIFDENGRAIPVTLVQAGPCTVTQVRTVSRDGYAAVQLGFGEKKVSRTTKPMQGHFKVSGSEPLQHLVEIRTDDAESYELGSKVTADVFAAGDKVDVIGISKGKGFAGVMKRHNFRGKPATHGTDRKHRSTGSVGAGTTPGRVFKGMRGPGRMGGDRTTIMSLEVVETDAEKGLLLIKGALPGHNGSVVIVRTAAKGGAK